MVRRQKFTALGAFVSRNCTIGGAQAFESCADLEGKSISSGSPGSGTVQLLAIYLRVWYGRSDVKGRLFFILSNQLRKLKMAS